MSKLTTGLDFYKDQRIPPFGDEVYLSETCPPVSGKNSVTFEFKIPFDQGLGLFTEGLAVR